MLTRRTLFTRLSALALAPLAKWLPGRKVDAGLDMNAAQLLTHDGWMTLTAGCGIDVSSDKIEVVPFGVAFDIVNGVVRIIPQEEA